MTKLLNVHEHFRTDGHIMLTKTVLQPLQPCSRSRRKALELRCADLSGKGMSPTGRSAMAIDRFSKSPFSFSTKLACNSRNNKHEHHLSSFMDRDTSSIKTAPQGRKSEAAAVISCILAFSPTSLRLLNTQAHATGVSSSQIRTLLTRSSAARETAWPEAARSAPSWTELATRLPMAFASPVPFWCGGVGSPKVALGAKVVLAPCVRKDCTWLAAARMLGRPLSALLAASVPLEASARDNSASGCAPAYVCPRLVSSMTDSRHCWLSAPRNFRAGHCICFYQYQSCRMIRTYSRLIFWVPGG